MISQMLLLVIATAACVNAYPHGDELAKGLSVFLDQLEVRIAITLILCSYAIATSCWNQLEVAS